MSDVRVVTNNIPRDIMDACELSAKEREEFDYLDWAKIDAGEDSASFFRYKGQLYDLGEFIHTDMPDWDGLASDSFFSGTVIRLVDDGERVVVGRVYS